LYWFIGSKILEAQKTKKWGDKIIELLSKDLQKDHPGTKGFSVANLKRMKLFSQYYQDIEIGAQTVRQLPWGQIIVLMQKVKDENQREWYAQKSIENGWSRGVLAIQIEQDLYSKHGIAENKLSNYKERLPSPQSDFAHELLKDPYNFQFLTIDEKAQEKEIEKNLIHHMKDFLIELGKGFAFVGSQYHVSVGSKDLYIDLLMYHLKLRCYVVIELKAVEFEAEHAGKLALYISAVDKQLRHKTDNKTIGILLCKSKDKYVAEYILDIINAPIGISEYKLNKAIPENIKSNLPTIEELENELAHLE
jgi:predicted nuclease of restriction endonuclease-like (RecB) superfamily